MALTLEYDPVYLFMHKSTKRDIQFQQNYLYEICGRLGVCRDNGLRESNLKVAVVKESNRPSVLVLNSIIISK